MALQVSGFQEVVAPGKPIINAAKISGHLNYYL
jgi:hypothetical protein